jgi:predicted RNA-binding Zn-ribbon protein involved in translation (DUF1610 family)
LIVLAIERHGVFWWFVAGHVLVVGWHGMRIRCPKCGNQVMRRHAHLKMAVHYTGWIPSHCPQCSLLTRSAWPQNRRGLSRH